MEKDTKERMEKAKCVEAEIENSTVIIRKVLGFLQLIVCDIFNIRKRERAQPDRQAFVYAEGVDRR